MVARMTHPFTRRLIMNVQSWALVAIPALLLVVGILHFRRPADFFDFRASYEPVPPAKTVAWLIAAGNRFPMIHDPHVLAYLGLPLVPAGAFALYNLGKGARPLLSALSFAVTLVGTVYLGGLFGMWTALFHGMGGVDPQYAAGATATFEALTAPHGAFLLTTTLAKLAIVGLLLQTLVLVKASAIPLWAPLVAAAGCAIIVAFWDLDNWMMIGEALILAGMWPLKTRRVAMDVATDGPT
jgi:hypothetical protein